MSLTTAIEQQLSTLTELEKKSWSIDKDHLIWNSPELQSAIGTWDEGIMFLIGDSSSGKTSFSLQALLNLLKCNEDVAILDVCLDDSFQERYRRYLSLLSRVKTSKISRPAACTGPELTIREKALEQLKEYITEGKLEIRSQLEDNYNIVTTLTAGIREFAKNRPGKKLVLLLDAWHDLSDDKSSSGIDPEKELFRQLNQTLKDVGMIGIVSAHKRKTLTKFISDRHANDDLKGSGALKYGSKIILSVYNDLKMRRDNALIFWNDSTQNNYKQPILEISVQKSKVSEYDGNIYYYFNPSTGNCKEVESNKAESCKEILRKAAVDENIKRGSR